MLKLKDLTKEFLSLTIVGKALVVGILVFSLFIGVQALQAAKQRGFKTITIEAGPGAIISSNGPMGSQADNVDQNGNDEGSANIGSGSGNGENDSSSSSGGNSTGATGSSSTPTSPHYDPAVPSLSPDVLIFDNNRDYSDAHQIYTMNSDGSNVQLLTNDPDYDHFFAKISPDRTQILYHRANKGGNGGDFQNAAIWVMNYDGTNHRQIRAPAPDYGWNLQGHAEWSPDGTEIVLTGGSGGVGDHYNVHIIDVQTGSIKRTVTNFQTGVAIDPSWSPSGDRIVFAGCDTAGCFPAGLDIYSVPASGGTVVQHNSDGKADYDPYISPDGTTVAWLTLDVPWNPFPLGQWGIQHAPWTPTSAFTSSWLIRDGNVNSKAEWSSDSQHIYFHRIVYGNGYGFQLWRMTRSGTDLTPLESTAPGRNQYPDIY